MFRFRYTLFLLLVSLGAPALAADDHKDEGKHGPAPKYEVTYHNEKGHHVSKTFDLGKAEEAKEFADIVHHGHAVEVVNKSAPTIDKMASLRSDLAFWSLGIFVVLLFVLGKFAWPKMLAGLKKREQNIRSALDEAEKARAEAKALMADLDRERAEAAGKVKAIIDEAKKDAQATADDLLVKARAEITTERERLRREIQIEVDTAMQGLWTKAADLATQASAKALRQTIDGPQHRRLIDDAINELRTTTSA